jgi:hypothetical protein
MVTKTLKVKPRHEILVQAIKLCNWSLSFVKGSWREWGGLVGGMGLRRGLVVWRGLVLGRGGSNVYIFSWATLGTLLVIK